MAASAYIRPGPAKSSRNEGSRGSGFSPTPFHPHGSSPVRAVFRPFVALRWPGDAAGGRMRGIADPDPAMAAPADPPARPPLTRFEDHPLEMFAWARRIPR